MGEIKRIRTAAETGLIEAFSSRKAALPGKPEPRVEAFSAFEAFGLPHRRVEEFKYTDIRALMREAAPLAEKPAKGEAKAPQSFKGLTDAVRIVIANGHVADELSTHRTLPEGVTITTLADALTRSDASLAEMAPVPQARANPLYQLNSAFMSDGAVIRVAAGTEVKTPIHLAFVNSGAAPFATATRVLLLVEDGASITVIESHEGSFGVAYQPNDVFDAVLGKGAVLRHARLNGEGDQALALSTLAVKLGAESVLESVNAVFGSAVARHQVFVTFAGEDARARINGTAMLKGRQHADTTLLVDHAVPGGDSKELFRTAIDGDATGVFQGKIIVQPHAQKTDGRMMSGCVLLSEGGTMMNKPELEIFADDVQCAHGATCGALDDRLLFYLMARGLPRPQAEALMIDSFIGEALEVIENETVREELIAHVEAWTSRRG